MNSIFYVRVEPGIEQNGTDPGNLPLGEFRLLQPIWSIMLKYDYYVRSPLFPVIYSVLFYFFCMLPFTIFDLYGYNWNWIQKYKIQSSRVVTWPQVSKAITLTMWNHLLYILPLSMAQWIWVPDRYLPAIAPSLWEFTWQQCVALVIFDLEYFLWHSIHHKVRPLYKYCHAVHHQYSSPHSWVTQYLHPWELISVGFFSTTSPWIVGSHPLTEVSFQMLAIWVSVEAHIGYDFPYLMHHWNPLWGGSIKHDMHHQKPLTNFAPFFNWWDMLAGSFCPGQLAGGRKSPALINWENNDKQAKQHKRQINIALQNVKNASEIFKQDMKEK